MAVSKSTTEKNLGKKKVEKQQQILSGQEGDNLAPPLVPLPGTSPLDDQPALVPIPVFNKYPNDRLIQSEFTNAMIRMGGDRNYQNLNLGDEGSAAIDIVAGMTGQLCRVRDKDGYTVKTNPSYQLDSARIYMSSTTNVDGNFAIASRKTPTSFASSAIAIKADDVRIISRNCLKLVTGTDSYSSKSKLIEELVGGIFLIAGNDDTEMHPLVLGDNLVKCLKAIISQQRKELMMESVEVLLEIPEVYDDLLPTLNSGPIPLVPDIPNPIKVVASVAKAAQLLFKSGLIVNEMLDQNLMERQFLEPEGADYILSSFNKTN